MGLLGKFFKGLADDIPIEKKYTPDELIAARIMRLMAEDFEAWATDHWDRSSEENDRIMRYLDTFKGKSAATREMRWNRLLRNKDDSIRMSYHITPQSNRPNIRRNFVVNGVVLDDKQGDEIMECHNKLEKDFNTAKEVARKAKLEMEMQEAKWNLAESLMNMVRTPEGALVPADQYVSKG